MCGSIGTSHPLVLQHGTSIDRESLQARIQLCAVSRMCCICSCRLTLRTPLCCICSSRLTLRTPLRAQLVKRNAALVVSDCTQEVMPWAAGRVCHSFPSILQPLSTLVQPACTTAERERLTYIATASLSRS